MAAPGGSRRIGAHRPAKARRVGSHPLRSLIIENRGRGDREGMRHAKSHCPARDMSRLALSPGPLELHLASRLWTFAPKALGIVSSCLPSRRSVKSLRKCGRFIDREPSPAFWRDAGGATRLWSAASGPTLPGRLSAPKTVSFDGASFRARRLGGCPRAEGPRAEGRRRIGPRSCQRNRRALVSSDGAGHLDLLPGHCGDQKMRPSSFRRAERFSLIPRN